MVPLLYGGSRSNLCNLIVDSENNGNCRSVVSLYDGWRGHHTSPHPPGWLRRCVSRFSIFNSKCHCLEAVFNFSAVKERLESARVWHALTETDPVPYSKP